MGENLVCPACWHATRKHGRDGCDAVNGSCWCDMTPEMIDGTEAVPAPAPPVPELRRICSIWPHGAHGDCPGVSDGTPRDPYGNRLSDPAPALAPVDEPDPAAIEVELTDEVREAARAELVESRQATQEMRETDGVDDEGLEDDPYGEGRDDWHDDDQGDELDGIGSQYIADPVERITELAKIAPEYVRPVGPEPPATELSLPPATFAAALDWWDSWRCRTCFSRYFTPRPCCGEQAESVRVFVVPREVSGG